MKITKQEGGDIEYQIEEDIIELIKDEN